jgi:serine/threonine-protein kinase HipA
MRSAEIFLFDRLVGRLDETDDGNCQFVYDSAYMAREGTEPISPTMPFKEDAYWSDEMLPFFDGLIPEGWLLDIAEETWKLNPRDRFGLLLACCRSCIGAVSVREIENGK